MRYLIPVILIIVFISSCKEEKEVDPVVLPEAGKRVFVLNEGNFQSANGSISAYDLSNNELRENVFQSNNGGRALGDVVQSMVEIDNRYFIVINNSSKIEVVDAETFQSVGKIENLNSPRYILPISSTKAYVSDLYQDEIYVINPTTLAIESTLMAKGWTEQMTLVGNRAFVTNVDSNQLLVYNVISDSLIAKIDVNNQPQHIALDIDNNVWVSCSGGINDAYPALIKINSQTLAVEKKLELADRSKSIGEIAFSASKTELFYLMNGVFKISITDTVLPSNPIIASNGRLFYGFGLRSKSDEIFLSDAIDYLQKGVVYRYDLAGNEINTFKAGIIPGEFYFP